jgi:hypothetical protein
LLRRSRARGVKTKKPSSERTSYLKAMEMASVHGLLLKGSNL